MSAARGGAGAGAGAATAPGSSTRSSGARTGGKAGGGKAPRPRAPRKGGKRKSAGSARKKDMAPKDWEAAMDQEAKDKVFVAENKRALVDAAMADLRKLADELDEDAWMFEPVSDLFDCGELNARSTRQHSHMSRAHLSTKARRPPHKL